MNSTAIAFYTVMASLVGMSADSLVANAPQSAPKQVQTINYDSSNAVNRYKVIELLEANKQGIAEIKSRQ